MDIIFILSQLQQRGLSQSLIAREVGCSQPTISGMAAGRSGLKRPSFKIISGLQTLAQKHGIEIEAPRRRKTDRTT